MEWINKPLGEIIQFKNGKKRPANEGEIPVYGGNGVLGYAADSNYDRCIIIGRVGAYCGSVYYEENACWVSDNAIAALPKSGTDTIYAYYLLKGLNLNKRHIGTSQPLLTQEILNRIECKIPSLEEQRQIGAVLQSLDHKITVNSKINDNLLQQAQALYGKFFPYDVADVLPAGWHVGTVGEIVEIHDSKRIPLSGAQRAKMEKRIYPYYGAASLMDYVDEYIFDGIYLLLGEDGTVVDDAGYPILQYVWGQFWVYNHAHILTGKLGFNVESLLLLFKRTPVKSIVTGAVQPKISQANLRSVQVVIPPQTELDAFNKLIRPMFDQIRQNQDQNTALVAIRDALLPKLMSGEVNVSAIQI